MIQLKALLQELVVISDRRTAGGVILRTDSRHKVGHIAQATLGIVLPALLVFLYGQTTMPWGDEVQFVDPAATAYYGGGFTSTAWPFQSSTELFMGNAPGYSMMLVPWFHCFGFGLTQSRAMCWFLAFSSAILIAAALRRLAPSLPWWLVSLAVCAAFAGPGVRVSLWSARYDLCGVFVGAAVFYSMTLVEGTRSRCLLFASGIFVFYSGFHLVIAAAVVFGAIAFMDHVLRTRALVVLAGVFTGGLSWMAVLASQGLLRKFVVITLGSQHSTVGQVAQFVTQGDHGLFAKLTMLLGLPTLDIALTGLVVVLAVFLWRSIGRKQVTGDLARYYWLIVIAVPLSLLFAGKFPVYYVWMAYMPAVCICALLAWRCREADDGKWYFALVTSLLVCIGLGTYSAGASVGFRVRDPSYAEFAKWVEAGLRPDDVVYSDFGAYFAARQVAAKVLVPTYGGTGLVGRIPEQDLVTCCVVRQSATHEVEEEFPGAWVQVSEFPGPSEPGFGDPFVQFRRNQ